MTRLFLFAALLIIIIVALVGCAALTPSVPVSTPVVSDRAADPYTLVEVKRGDWDDFKEIGIIEGLSNSGCDIQHFETTTGPANRSAISVDCK